MKWVQHPMHDDVAVRIVTLVSMQPIHDDKKKSNRPNASFALGDDDDDKKIGSTGYQWDCSH